MESKYRVSFEVAKKLKDAGFPQDDCDAYWCEDITMPEGNDHWLSDKKGGDFQYAAPCVGRLGAELPTITETKHLDVDGGYCVMSQGSEIINGKEADARALTYIELKKRDLL